MDPSGNEASATGSASVSDNDMPVLTEISSNSTIQRTGDEVSISVHATDNNGGDR